MDDDDDDKQQPRLHPLGNPEKKRRRPPLACEQCRKRKIRCDRSQPCTNCIKSNIPSCTYASAHVPAWRARKADRLVFPSIAKSLSKVEARSIPSSRVIRPATSAHLEPRTSESELDQSTSTRTADTGPTSVSHNDPNFDATSSSGVPENVEWLVARVHELEEKLAEATRLNERNTPKSGQDPRELVEPTPGVLSQSRYMGQNHWLHGVNLFPFEYELIGGDEPTQGELYTSILRCKALGRKIKKNRLKPLSSTNLGTQIPARDLADRLVENYLRTFEGVFRIVHVPTFREEYEHFWSNTHPLRESFVILLQLILALGATLHDPVFSLRPTATQWIYEAQLWLMLPSEKKKVNVVGIQIMCLLLLAKSTCNVGTDLTWIMAGALVRKAMFLGFHRDPRHLSKMTTYRAELRRRLWATILELNMQFSLEAGGSPLLSLAHYDTQPPANLNDEELSNGNDGNAPAVKGPNIATQTSVQRMLLSTIPLRMNLVNHINNTRPGDVYEEALRLNSDLTKACRSVTETLTLFKERSNSPVTSFHVSIAEMFLYRCFHSLHQPIIVKYLNDARFYFSRKMCLDSALKITNIWGFPDAWPTNTTATSANIMDPDLKCLVTNGTGMFHNVASQAIIVVQAELLHQQSGPATGLGYLPSVGGGDLHACLAAAQAWNIERCRAGETNTKGIIFLTAGLAHVKALEAGLGSKGKALVIVQAALDVSRQCFEVLKEVAEREGLPSSEWEDDEPVDVDGISGHAMDWIQDWSWDEAQGITFPQWEPDLLESGGLMDNLTFEADPP